MKSYKNKYADSTHKPRPSIYEGVDIRFKTNSPKFISIIGPANSGRSAIYNGICEYFGKENVNTDVPYTFIHKKRKMTLYKPINDFHDIIDTLKVSDLVILVVNLEVGLEKDTLEVINVINAIGIMKIMVVYSNNKKKSLNNKKKTITKRIQKEFGFKFNFFDFEKDNMSKIGRAIEIMKITYNSWKSLHPYIVVDKEDGGYLCGYLRGRPISMNTKLHAHIPGYGDYVISDIKKDNNKNEIEIEQRSGYYKPEIVDLNSNGEILENIYDQIGDKEESSSDEKNLSDLRENALKRFKKKATTEEELKEKFLEGYSEETSDLEDEDSDCHSKFSLKNEIEKLPGMIIPGEYCKLKVNIKYNRDRILIIGGYLIGEDKMTALQGRVVKNKWQKKDLKTNSPYFFSMGWARFQSIPIFGKDNKAIKYVRGTTGCEYSEIIFYGPFVETGTGFLIFDLNSDYRILGHGQILNSNGAITMKKKLKLVGYPKKIMGNNVIVQSMFSSGEEVNKFINAKLGCASGLRGILKRAIGNSGDFRGSFEGEMLPSDIVFIRCYIPFFPMQYCKHILPNEKLLRSLVEIKKEKGIPLYEPDMSDTSEVIETKFIEDNRKKKAKIIEDSKIKNLKYKLSFFTGEKKIDKENFDLPTPPEDIQFKEEKILIEQRRQIKEAQEKTKKIMKKTEKERKKQLEQAEIQLRRKTNAIESKRSKEKGGNIKKKFSFRRK